MSADVFVNDLFRPSPSLPLVSRHEWKEMKKEQEHVKQEKKPEKKKKKKWKMMSTSTQGVYPALFERRE